MRRGREKHFRYQKRAKRFSAQNVSLPHVHSHTRDHPGQEPGALRSLTMQVLELKVKRAKELNPEGRCTQRLKADEKLSLKWVLILRRMVKAKST